MNYLYIYSFSFIIFYHVTAFTAVCASTWLYFYGVIKFYLSLPLFILLSMAYSVFNLCWTIGQGLLVNKTFAFTSVGLIWISWWSINSTVEEITKLTQVTLDIELFADSNHRSNKRVNAYLKVKLLLFHNGAPTINSDTRWNQWLIFSLGSLGFMVPNNMLVSMWLQKKGSGHLCLFQTVPDIWKSTPPTQTHIHRISCSC